MFSHSVRVPRLYKISANLAKDVSEGKGSLKELVYTCKHPNLKALYALVAQVFQKSSQIEFLLRKTKILEKEGRFDPWLAKILIVELLWGKKRLSGQCKPVQTILGYEQILKAYLSDEVQEERVEIVDKPRYVRVNTLKISVADAINNFREEGWMLQRSLGSSYSDFLEKISKLGAEEFIVDFHIPYLLVFPPKTQFYKHDAYRKGSIILQDKASCLPVHILNPPPGSTVLDMCAAPGMKTTQCAALMKDEGHIYAIEINKKRFATLEKIIENAGTTCIKPICEDVLRLRNDGCPNTEYILVDPSCSGSGICDRFETGQEVEPESRIEKLAGFQIKILRHALTQFPQAKKVVYSTCSLFPEENEDVVRQVLETCTQFKLVLGQNFVGAEWKHFGSGDFGEIGKACLYTRPDIDLTNGFFVAVFERLEEGERNEFLNAKLFALQKKHQKEQKRKERREQTILAQEKDMDGLVNTKMDSQFEEATEVETEGTDKNVESQEDVINLENAAGKKKKKQRKTLENFEVINQNYMNTEAVETDGNPESEMEKGVSKSVESKKKKRNNKINECETPCSIDLNKNNKRTNEDFIEMVDPENQEVVAIDLEKTNSKKKKKKRKKEIDVEITDCETNNTKNIAGMFDLNAMDSELVENGGNLGKQAGLLASKKKKKKKNEQVGCDSNNFTNQEAVVIGLEKISGKKKKKNKKSEIEVELVDCEASNSKNIAVIADQNHMNGEWVERNSNLENKAFLKDSNKKKKRKTENYVDTVSSEANNFESQEAVADLGYRTEKKKRKGTTGLEKIKKVEQKYDENQETVEIQVQDIKTIKRKKKKKCKLSEELTLETSTENLNVVAITDVQETENGKVKKEKKKKREIFKAINDCTDLNNQCSVDTYEAIINQTSSEKKRRKKKHKLISNDGSTEVDIDINRKEEFENIKDIANLKRLKSKKEKYEKALVVAELDSVEVGKKTKRMCAVDFF